MTNASKSSRVKNGDIPIWRWVVAAIGFAAVAGSISFMGYEAIRGDSSPPDIKIYIDSIITLENGYLVKFRAVNQGGSTAAVLTVEGKLKNITGVIETSETMIDYIPSLSERKGGLFFSEDPRKFELELRAEGYVEP